MTISYDITVWHLKAFYVSLNSIENESHKILMSGDPPPSFLHTVFHTQI
jgi:hypothetical protein